MSIATRTGDSGTTGLMYNRRVSKTDSRVEACGAIDELNAALGHAKATSEQTSTRDKILLVQKDLVLLMGEIATLPEDLPRYTKDGYETINGIFVEKLDQWVAELEGRNISFKGWATPGDTIHAAALDLARVACRRAERRVCALFEQKQLSNGEILKYLNRLSDTLWLLARDAETKH
jgi:cob(I)alamin adenosyltransferase